MASHTIDIYVFAPHVSLLQLFVFAAAYFGQVSLVKEISNLNGTNLVK